MLKPRLGDQWNSTWQAAGFSTNSLALPDNPLTLLQQLRSYFAANPTHEVPSLTPIAVTGAACEAAAQAISDAATASNQSNVNAGQAKKNLEDGIRRARTRLTGLREELGQLLNDDDDLWYAFGFDKPSDPETPEAPQNLVVTPGAPGSKMFFVDWDDARRGHSYRATAYDTATPPNKVTEVIVHESEATFTLASVASGTAVRFRVSARNRTGGESTPNGTVTATVP